jgi:hypothetical protein
MTITISELFDTGQEILTFDEFDSPTEMSDLMNLDNLIFTGKRSVCINGNEEGDVRFSKAQHPSGGGSMRVCYFVRVPAT